MPSRVFRVFVSSTFSDLVEERNALHRDVFPKLQELCRDRGARFQAVDLRWGVSDEAGVDQRTILICLNEIKRCQRVTPNGPNFIVLLGERYGWCPPPSEIPADEFEAIRDCVLDEQRNMLAKWYRRDDNAVPPAYILQRREGEFRDYTEWEKVERQLHDTLETAAQALSLTSQQRSKYTDSATEQEIHAGLFDVPDTSQHVQCFLRTIEGLPEDGQAGTYVDLNLAGFPDGVKHEKLKRLKAELDTQLPSDHVRNYTAHWTGSGVTTNHIQQLCDDVYASLEARLKAELGDAQTTDVLDEEISAQEAFGRERARSFVGRVTLLQIINAYLKWEDQSLVLPNQKSHGLAMSKLPHEQESVRFIDRFRAVFRISRQQTKPTDPMPIATIVADRQSIPSTSNSLKSIANFPLAIYGVGGVGKSTLMARAVQGAREAHPNAVIIYRFIGATVGASGGRDLLASVCREIARRYGANDSQIPLAFKDLVPAFKKQLALASSDRPLILFLDALDQLSDQDNARNLTWLPTELPEHVRLVVSTLAGECLSVLERTLPGENRIELTAMPLDEGQFLLDSWLREAGRALQPEQQNVVLDAFAHCGQPLYLKLALEEARLWHSYDALPTIGSNTPALISNNLFSRLEMSANHGPLLVSRSLSYLGAAKNGLTEDELIDVLSQDAAFFKDFKQNVHHELPEDRLPFGVWSRLYFDLEPYLTERGADATSLMAFYHRQFAEAVTNKYLDQSMAQERYIGLANYFKSGATYRVSEGWRVYNVRKLSELPYQQTLGGLQSDVKTTLTDLAFVAAKTAILNAFSVDEDYQRALAAAEDDLLRLLQRQFANMIHLLNRCETPSAVTATLYNRLKFLPVLTASCQSIESDIIRPYLQASYPLPDLPHPALIRTLTGHTNMVRSCAYSPDGQSIVSASLDNTLKVWDAQTGQERLSLIGHTDKVESCGYSLDGQSIVSASDDKTLKVWDAHTGQERFSLTGHTDKVRSCAYSPDGQSIVSASGDKTLRIWDAHTGQECLSLTGHTHWVESCGYSPDGQSIVSASRDKTLKVWDAHTGQERFSLIGHTNQVYGCGYSPDGQSIVSASMDYTLKVWDAHTGQERLSLTGHMLMVTSCAYSPDGQSIVSASGDKTLKVWDAHTGQERFSLTGHTHTVTSCGYSPDGRSIVSASDDNTLKVWDAHTGQERLSLADHTNAVYGCSYSPDGQSIVSNSGDKTLKVWDALTGQERLSLIGHIERVESCAYSPDGRSIVSASMDDTLKVWDAHTGQERLSLTGHTHWVTSCAYSPDGRSIVSASDDKTLKVWDAHTGQERLSLTGHTHWVKNCAYSPDGRSIVSASEDKTLKVWDAHTGQERLSLIGHIKRVTSCGYSPDGHSIVSASEDKTLKVWDAHTGQERFSLIGHTDGVTSCGYSPDGQFIVSASWDKTLKIWDAHTSNCRMTFFVEGVLFDTAWSPDGNYLVAGGASGLYWLEVVWRDNTNT